MDEEKYANRLAESDHIMVTIEEDFVTMVTTEKADRAFFRIFTKSWKFGEKSFFLSTTP